MNKDCEKATAHSQNILHGDTLYNIKRKKCKTVCAELTWSGKKILVYCDNIVTMQIIKNGRAKEPFYNETYETSDRCLTMRYFQ
jgi:hypothetical protein